MSRVYNVLVLCTGNSARSVMAEGLINVMGHGRFKAYSAGSKPSGQVHPLTLETLQNLGLATEGLWSKTVDDCEQYNVDVVITVCDSAAQEACPLYLGGAIKAHWGLADPSHLELPKAEKLKAFQVTVDHINRRLDALFALDTAQMSRPELIAAINQISHIE